MGRHLNTRAKGALAATTLPDAPDEALIERAMVAGYRDHWNWSPTPKQGDNMKTIAVRFQAGDKVFAADTSSGPRRETCPDCLGERVWACTLPNGEALNIPCPTCSHGYDGSRGYLMETWTVEPRVTAGVIGSVRLDTSRADSPEYSLDSSSSEGSYRIFRDEVLFLTREEALAVATKMAAEQQVRLTETNNLARMRKRADRPGSLVAYLRRRLGTLTKETSDTKAHIARLVQAHPRMKTDGEVTG